MRKQINLIPNEMAVQPNVVRVAKFITKLSFVGFIVFVLILISVISLVFYYNNQNNIIIANTNVLKARILELEKSEQKLVLAKDKLSKISYIKKIDSIDTELDSLKNIENIVAGLTGASFKSSAVTPKMSENTFIFSSSNEFDSFVKSISTLSEFRNVTLSSLNFKPNIGYISTLVFAD